MKEEREGSSERGRDQTLGTGVAEDKGGEEERGGEKGEKKKETKGEQ